MGYPEIGFTIFFAVVYYSAGELEAKSGAPNHGVLWGALSIGVSLLAYLVFGAGLIGLIVLQALLLVGIATVRVLIDR